MCTTQTRFQRILRMLAESTHNITFTIFLHIPTGCLDKTGTYTHVGSPYNGNIVFIVHYINKPFSQSTRNFRKA